MVAVAVVRLAGTAAVFRAATTAVVALLVVSVSVATVAVFASSRSAHGADAVFWKDGLGVERDFAVAFILLVLVVGSAVFGDTASAAVVTLVFSFRAMAVLAARWGADGADAVFRQDSASIERDAVFLLLFVVDVRFAVFRDTAAAAVVALVLALAF